MFLGCSSKKDEEGEKIEDEKTTKIMTKVDAAVVRYDLLL